MAKWTYIDTIDGTQYWAVVTNDGKIGIQPVRQWASIHIPLDQPSHNIKEFNYRYDAAVPEQWRLAAKWQKATGITKEETK